MNTLELTLFAELYSEIKSPSLISYERGLRLLASGERLTSKGFLDEDPAFFNEIQKLSKPELQARRDALERAIDSGCELLYRGHPRYPKELLGLSEPAFLLRIKGEPVWTRSRGFSVVGSREPTEMTLQWMEEHLSKVVETLPLYTISGGARGVDQKIHSLSLRKEAPTVVFLPSGLDCIYPSLLESWVPLILERGGVLVSEYKNDQPMRKDHFQARNRLIAGLGVATLVIEARKKSGTMITARQAMEQGKPVLVLPSHPSDNKAQGGLDLICDGATPVRDAEDLCVFLESEILYDFPNSAPIEDPYSGYH